MDILSFGGLMATTPEGKLRILHSSLNHKSCEPTYFEAGKKKASCIDLIVTDQPNLVLDSKFQITSPVY